MNNPFEKRATEYLRDDEAFLSVVTPDSLDSFIRPKADEDRLYDRLVLIVGTPGSGKTTISRLFQHSVLNIVSKNQDHEQYKEIATSLSRCKALNNGSINILGARIPLEGDYRQFWEFPYEKHLCNGLLFSMLQARAVLNWLRSLETVVNDIKHITIIPKPNTDAALINIGGTDGASVLQHARDVENAIYEISTSLIPPTSNEMPTVALSPYQPFDVIDYITYENEGIKAKVKPLVMFDDAHVLHQEQFKKLYSWLTRRELSVSRWVLTRLDPLNTKEILSLDAGGNNDLPNIQPGREVTQIRLQRSQDDRVASKQSFKKMAKSMANRYLSRMPLFYNHGHRNLSLLLNCEPPSELSKSIIAELQRSIESLQKKYKITLNRRFEIENLIKEAHPELQYDTFLMVESILFYRYANRTHRQFSLLDDNSDPNPSRPLVVDQAIITAAKMRLMHKYHKPYYYGIDKLCDASTENAEQFLQLASALVSYSESRIIKGKKPTIDAKSQNKLLREKALDMINDWHFPYHIEVRKLANAIVKKCIKISYLGNAPLGSGACAIGFPAFELESMDKIYPELANTIKYAIAYNILTFLTDYKAKNKVWCLLELNGTLLIANDLTLKKGGFIESSLDELNKMLEK